MPKSYNFKPLKKTASSRASAGYGPDGPSNPLVRISSHRVYLPEPIYQELGLPPKLVAEVDERNRAFRLVAADRGYKVSRTEMLSGGCYYEVFNLASSPHAYRSILGTLPTGWYRPVGGGIFEYDRPTASKRQSM